jgi:hypothetical protein
MKWFRFYHEFMDDPKVAMMGDSDQLLWVKALCLASESKQRGYILLADDEICWRLRITLQVWKHAIDKFRAKGMIEHCTDGYRIVNWDSRQFESDSSAKRVAKHRSSKAELKNCNVTSKECNVTSTVTETRKHRFSSVTETPPDTDTDTEPDPDPDPKISLSPKGSLSQGLEQPNSRERETGASALSTAEQPAASRATATIAPETKPNPGRSQTSNGQGQCSAAPPPEIFELNQWANFRAPGNHPRFWDSVLRRTQRFKNRPESPECAAEKWIQRQGYLLWREFEKANGLMTTHYHCEIDCPENLQWYLENPVLDLAEDIAEVEANWRRLNLKNNDDRWINWLEKVDSDQEPAYGFRNLPDSILRKLADDLRKTPC